MTTPTIRQRIDDLEKKMDYLLDHMKAIQELLIHRNSHEVSHEVSHEASPEAPHEGPSEALHEVPSDASHEVSSEKHSLNRRRTAI